VKRKISRLSGKKREIIKPGTKTNYYPQKEGLTVND